MSGSVIYKGRASSEMYNEYMDFINLAFGFDSPENDFLAILPKLYKTEYNPCYNNFIISENGKIFTAVGVYDSKLKIGNEELSHCGIGNVGVHPDARSKGYMSECMNLALDEICSKDYDLVTLGGNRHRYQHFGFETACPKYDITLRHSALRHVYQNTPYNEIEIRDVTAEDTEILDKMYALHLTRKNRTVRERNDFYNILCSWKLQPRAFIKDGEVIGYCVDDLEELTLKDMSYFDDVIRSFVAKFGGITFSIPNWDKKLMSASTKIAYSLSSNEDYCVNVLNYKKVIYTFLKFKSEEEKLADGKLSLFVHGYKGEEKLLISVKNNSVSVEDFDGEAELELEHIDAVRFLFGLYSPHRELVRPEIAAYFPLPLFIDRTDHV